MAIRFFTEDYSFQLDSPASTRKWIRAVIREEGSSVGELSFVFCSDQYLHKINLEYLKHDTLTDIITFDNAEEDNVIAGDIFISIDRVKENADRLRFAFDMELHRVIIHGVLHLLGYTDKNKTGKNQMRQKEDTYLSLRAVPRGTK